MPSDTDLALDFAAEYLDAVNEGRPAELAAICRSRPDLIGQVRELLGLGGQLAEVAVQVAKAASPSVAEDDPMPDRVGRYELRHELGRGAFGVAYRAHDPHLNRDVAVKLLRRKWSGNAGAATRFLDEARITAQLQHPTVPPVHELGEHADGRPWMAMKLIKGRTLHDMLRENDPTLNRLGVFVGVCQGVSYAHSKGVIHRDLKPANVMVGAFGEVQVMDWGLAKVLGFEPAVEPDRDETLGSEIPPDRASEKTRAGSFLGSPAYMPPEQAVGAVDKIDRRSDVFGLGAILCHLLTGQPPFVGGTAESTRQLAALGKVQVAFDRLDACRAAPELVALCKRCLAPERENRPADAAEVTNELVAISQAAEDRARRWRRNKLLVGLSFLLAIGGAVLLGIDGVRQRATSDTLREKNRELDGSLYIQRIVAANQELSDRNPARAAKLLADCPADRRGWDWWYLNRWSDGLPQREFPHPVGVWTVSASGNGRLATGAIDGKVRFWDAATGREMLTYSDHVGLIGAFGFLNAVLFVDFDPTGGGDRGVSATALGEIHAWRIDGTKVRQLWNASHDPPGQPTALRYSPDGRLVASASWGGSINLRSADDGRWIRAFAGHDARINGVAFRSDGRLLATASQDRTVRLWNPDTGERVATLTGHRSEVRDVAFGPAGTDWVASASYDGTVRVWRTTDGAELAVLAGNASPVLTVAVSPDGKWLASGGFDKTIKLWDTATWEERITLRGHTDMIWTLAWDPAGHRLTSASFDKTVRVWDGTPQKYESQESSIVADEWLNAVAYHPDGRLLAVGWNGAVVAGENGSTAAPPAIPRHGTELWGAAFSRDGSRLATTSWDKHVRLWDTASGTLVHDLACADAVQSVAFAPNGERFAATLWNGTVRVGSADGKPIKDLRHGLLLTYGVAFSPDGATLATAGGDKTVVIWNANTFERVGTLDGHTAAVQSVAYSPNGKWVATACWDGDVRVYEFATRQLKYTLKGHTNRVNAVAFSPDGRWLASGSEDKSVKLWRTAALGAAGKPDFQYLHRESVWGVAFHPTVPEVASVGWDRAVRVRKLPE